MRGALVGDDLIEAVQPILIAHERLHAVEHSEAVEVRRLGCHGAHAALAHDDELIAAGRERRAGVARVDGRQLIRSGVHERELLAFCGARVHGESVGGGESGPFRRSLARGGQRQTCESVFTKQVLVFRATRAQAGLRPRES
ncbi:hypothetical protein D3C73_1173960 [compost metagenome]